MKPLKVVLIFLMLQTASSCFSQSYEAIYEVASSDIQNKMNTNKMNGVAILSDINATFQIGLTGLLASERDTFLTLLLSDSRIQTVDLSTDNTSLSIVANASFFLTDFNLLLASTSGILTGNVINYSLNDN